MPMTKPMTIFDPRPLEYRRYGVTRDSVTLLPETPPSLGLRCIRLLSLLTRRGREQWQRRARREKRRYIIDKAQNEVLTTLHTHGCSRSQIALIMDGVVRHDLVPPSQAVQTMLDRRYLVRWRKRQGVSLPPTPAEVELFSLMRAMRRERLKRRGR